MSELFDPVDNATELQLTTMKGDLLFGSVINVSVDEVDELIKKYISRGLEASGRERSPVHPALPTKAGDEGSIILRMPTEIH